MYKDCSWTLEQGLLTLENSRIRRTIRIDGTGMTPIGLYDKCTGKSWARPEEECFTIPVLFAGMEVSVFAGVEDHEGLSDAHLAVHVRWENGQGDRIERVFELYPEQPFLHMRWEVRGDTAWTAEQQKKALCTGTEMDYAGQDPDRFAELDTIDMVMLPRGHYQLHEVTLIDQSDRNDTLVREQTRPLYTSGWGADEGVGNLFTIEDRLDGQAVMLVKEAPALFSMLGRDGKDLHIRGNRAVHLCGTGLMEEMLQPDGLLGYGSTLGVGAAEDMPAAFRKFYRAIWHPGDHVRVLSNTWGDRSQDRAICEEFLLKEIDTAAKLGVQVMQIDDGWETGFTSNSAMEVSHIWEGYYDNDPDFWKVNEKKFPNGLEPLVESAKEKGVEIGLWFSPDSSRDFANWDMDARQLLQFYHKYGIRRFKLDGVKLRNKLSERNFLRMLEKLHRESRGQICVNLDITAEIRMGHLYYREHGNLFVENRYTDFGSYYPHNTMKNLWQLSRYIPASRLQMECLNHGRNRDKYPEGDPFAPETYSMDYLFAVTMAASPLIWMEMSHLSKEDAAALAKVIHAYLPHQKAIGESDTAPIGQMPDGQSFTGFHIKENETAGYLLLFREVTKEAGFRYELPELAGKELAMEVIVSNLSQEELSLEMEGEYLKAEMGQPRTYALVRYEVK